MSNKKFIVIFMCLVIVTTLVKLRSLAGRDPSEVTELPEIRTHRRNKRADEQEQQYQHQPHHQQKQQQPEHNELSASDKVAARALGPIPPNDPELITLLKEKYLIPPSELPYNLMLGQTGPLAENYNKYRTTFDSWETMYLMTQKFFKGMPKGFFVEAGALDGEFISNTLYLEQELGWKGLLVEADPTLYEKMVPKNRKAWLSPSCISINNYPERVTFKGYDAEEGADLALQMLVRSTGNVDGVHAPAAGLMGKPTSYQVQCFPLITYLLALNITHIDYFSLDVEGAEADILFNLPWDKVDVTIWSIEHREEITRFKDHFQPNTPAPPPPDAIPADNNGIVHVKEVVMNVTIVQGRDPTEGRDDFFVRFMSERGYEMYDYWDGDYIFIKRKSKICDLHCPSKNKRKKKEQKKKV